MNLPALLSLALRGHRPAKAGRPAAVAACVGAFLAVAPGTSLHAQETGVPGTRVLSRAYLSYVDDEGTARRDSADATVFVRSIPALALTPPRDGLVAAAERRVLAHRLENLGTGPDAFRLELVGPAGWAAGIYLDLDGDGQLGPNDAPYAGPVLLQKNGVVHLLIAVDCPADATPGQVSLSLRAISAADPLVSATVQDRLLVRRPVNGTMFVLALGKSVDRADVGGGDTLSYSLTFANSGLDATPDATLADTLPAGLAYVPGSLRMGGAPLTDAAGDDAGDATARVVRVLLGRLAPGTAGSVTFRATVDGDAPAVLANVAHLSAGDSATSASAGTRVELPRLAATKTLLGSDSIRVGQEAEFRIGYSNYATLASVQNAEIVDTLPAELAFVRAEPAAEVVGQVVRWSLGTLRAGQTGTVTVVTRALRPSANRAPIVNVANLRGANAAVASATAAPMAIRSFQGDELAIAKVARALEAELGDVVPYVVTVTNRSPGPLRDVVVHDRLAPGTAFARTGLQGSDSVRANGRDVTFFVAGTLAPGASAEVKYAASIVEPGRATSLRSTAWAEAEGGLVRTDTVSALLRVRRGLAMRGRTVIGKVWVDRNDDGEQQAGEEGAPNMRVWTADGQVVTTDAEGRFSLRDLGAGTYAFRLDTAGAPRRTRLPGAAEGMRVIQFDGWTARRVTFRLVPDAPLCDASTGDPMAGAAPATLAVSALLPLAGLAVPAVVASADSAARPVAAKPDLSGAADTIATIPALRAAEERAAESRRSFIDGPSVRLAAPGDGAVVSSNRIFVRVQGEGGAPVKLFVGDSIVRSETLRPDGSADFVGVELPVGTHTLRVAMQSSWNRERWDSLSIHRAGVPTTFVGAPSSLTLRADAPELVTARLRVLDQWGVPVAGAPAITVEAEGAELAGSDVDPSSLGTQLRLGGAGWLEVAMRAGHDVGPGRLVVRSGTAADTIPLRVLPSSRALIVSGVGQVGIGAAPDAFAAVTARGAVTKDVTVSVSYDSRRGDASQFFDRGFDPLNQSEHPTVGDGSSRQTIAPSAKQLSARVERGYDYVEVGDVQTAGAGEGRLGDYRRSLTGVSAKVGTGALSWQGFGSVTRQALQHRQLRGDGSSGPYLVGSGIRPGTERVAVEIRDRENAARVISREELVRFNDYQIDYTAGIVLLRRAIPSADAYGNPVYVVVLVERLSGGDARLVGGLRLEADARRALGLGAAFDSLGLGLVRVHDAGANTGAATAVTAPSGYELSGVDLTVRRRGITLQGELLRAQSADSAGVAGRAAAQVRVGGAGRLELQWMRVGEGFASPSDPRLASALDEIRVGGEWRFSELSTVRVKHERQRFSQYGVERATTSAGAEQSVLGRRVTQELALASDSRAGETGSMLTGRLGASVSERVDVWAEGVKAMSHAASAGQRPDQVGAGASLRVVKGLRAELSHRWARTSPDSDAVQLTSATLRSEGIFGGSVWGGVERAASLRAQHAAVLGWSQHLAMGRGWSASANLERRFGLAGTPLADPSRALPFAQADRDRWSLSGGLEWLPGADLARASLRGELHDGVLRQGSRIQLQADAAFGANAALLTQHDWSQDRRPTVTGGAALGEMAFSRDDRSLLGLALRPASSDVLNALLKLEWRRTVSPASGGAVATAGEDARLVGATELVWAPAARTEISTRYAARWSASRLAVGDPRIAFDAHYAGARAERRLSGRFAVAGDARLLLENASGSASWSLSPSIVTHLNQHIQAEAGWRLGPLEDPDFAAVGGRGLYATLGVRITEDLLASPAAFWRARVAK